MKKYKKNAVLFADARRALLGHLGTAVLSFFVFTVLDLFLSQVSASFSAENGIAALALSAAAAYVTALFTSLFGIGLSYFFLNLVYGQPASALDLFVCFRNDPDRSVRVRAFITLGEKLCMAPLQLLLFFTPRESLVTRLPLLVPVCLVSLTAFAIWSLTYSMANYLLLDFPDTEAGQILRTSRGLMRGNRIRLLCLQLRVAPLHLLGIFSLGIANLYAGCCQNACSAAFYKDMMEPSA